MPYPPWSRPDPSRWTAIHNLSSSRFYSALAALLFIALCAYLGSALYGGLETPRTVINLASTEDKLRLKGIVLRREEQLENYGRADFSALDGVRLSSGEKYSPEHEALTQSAVFFTSSDGYEYLSPEDAVGLSPALLTELLSSRPESAVGPRLVYGFDYYYAAFLSGSEDISPGPCRVKFQGFDDSCRAQLISVSHHGGKTALLLRLTQGGPEYLSLRFAEAELIE